MIIKYGNKEDYLDSLQKTRTFMLSRTTQTFQWEDCQAQGDSIKNFDFDRTELYTFENGHA